MGQAWSLFLVSLLCFAVRVALQRKSRAPHPFLIELFRELILNYTVGGTSGIGESTARAFIRNTDASRAYIIGRDQARAAEIIKELQQMKPDSQITFIKSDVSLLREVDNACSLIQQKEDKVNILFLSPGIGTMKGRDGMIFQI